MSDRPAPAMARTGMTRFHIGGLSGISIIYLFLGV